MGRRAPRPRWHPARVGLWLSHEFGRRVSPRYRRPLVILFRYTRALGDNLMLTTLAREVRKRNPDALIHVVTGLPELFLRNPDVDLVSPEPERKVPLLGRFLVRYEHRFPWNRHLLYYCAECVDIHDEIELRTYLYPSEADREWAEGVTRGLGSAPVLVLRQAGPRTDKKNWPTPYWRALVPRLLKDAPVVDVGMRGSGELEVSHPGFLDLRGGTTLHQLAALMERSRLLITPVSGPLHMAPACGLPSLAIVGGSEPAVATEYPGCRSLESRPSCHNCYEAGPCGQDFICLRSIHPDTVYAAAAEMLAGKEAAA